jgi:hypothetical protein
MAILVQDRDASVLNINNADGRSVSHQLNSLQISNPWTRPPYPQMHAPNATELDISKEKTKTQSCPAFSGPPAHAILRRREMHVAQPRRGAIPAYIAKPHSVSTQRLLPVLVIEREPIRDWHAAPLREEVVVFCALQGLNLVEALLAFGEEAVVVSGGATRASRWGIG